MRLSGWFFLLTSSLSISTSVLAEPPFMGSGPEPWGPRHHFGPDYRTVVVAGVTYFVLDNLWYVMHGHDYVQVPSPQSSNVTIINNPAPATTTVVTSPSDMAVVDVNGIRYYVKNGHYFQLRSDGQYIEVTPPRAVTG